MDLLRFCKGEYSLLRKARRLISSEWSLLLMITVLAGVLRLYALDVLPPGLYHDEALNGLDALCVLEGRRPLFFEANNGREPLFIYLTALSISFLGRSPLAIRLVAALLGTLTVPAAYLMARELLGRRIALFTALITTGAFWHLNLSRVGFRAVSFPLLIALCLWRFSRGLRTGHWRDFALGGTCLGLSLYTYTVARFVPLAFLALIAYWLLRRLPVRWRGLLLLFGVALMVAVPLLAYAAQHLDMFIVRSAQVSVFNPDVNQGDVTGTLVRHVIKTLGMFNWRGDSIPRHNMPYRPVFDAAMGLFFFLGLMVTVWRAAQRREYALLLIFFAVMLVPTVLAEDAPHFLRAVGILPVLFIFPAVGLRILGEMLEGRPSQPLGTVAVALVLGMSLGATLGDYFERHVHSEGVYYNFEAGAVELASEINGFIGTGWQRGAGWSVLDTQAMPQRRLLLDERLWDDWASLRYLVPDTSRIVLLGEVASPPVISEDRVRLVVWPSSQYQHHLASLPTGSQISVWEGPLERGDLEEEAHLLCLTYEAAPPEQVPSNLAVSFERGIELLGYDLAPGSPGTRLRLFWRAGAVLDEDYSVFVHLRRGDQMVAQSDSYPSQGYYPTHLWRPGDVVADDHHLAASVNEGEGYSLTIGLYLLQTMERLQVLDGSDAVVADAVTIVLP